MIEQIAASCAVRRSACDHDMNRTPLLDAEIYDDVTTWRRPIPGRGNRFRPARTARRRIRPTRLPFSVVQLSDDELAGEALLRGIDLHNRPMHLALALRLAFRGHGFGVDVVQMLCHCCITRGVDRHRSKSHFISSERRTAMDSDDISAAVDIARTALPI